MRQCLCDRMYSPWWPSCIVCFSPPNLSVKQRVNDEWQSSSSFHSKGNLFDSDMTDYQYTGKKETVAFLDLSGKIIPNTVREHLCKTSTSCSAILNLTEKFIQIIVACSCCILYIRFGSNKYFEFQIQVYSGRHGWQIIDVSLKRWLILRRNMDFCISILRKMDFSISILMRSIAFITEATHGAIQNHAESCTMQQSSAISLSSFMNLLPPVPVSAALGTMYFWTCKTALSRRILTGFNCLLNSGRLREVERFQISVWCDACRQQLNQSKPYLSWAKFKLI